MKKLSILGYYGFNNCGDEALKAAVAKIFDKSADYSYTTPEGTTPLNETVVMGGGDIIKNYFLKRLVGHKNVKILGAGLGYETELDLLLQAGNITEAFFRNKVDAELAVAKGLNAHYTPDLAFVLDPPPYISGYVNSMDNPVYHPRIVEKPKDGKKLLGIMVADNISASYKQTDPQQIHYGQYLKNELALVLNDLRDYYKVIFIPMSHARYGYDVKMIYEILSYLPASVKLDFEVMPYTDTHYTHTIQTVSEMDLMISMRFHGLIFSTLTGTPFINIGVTRKNKTFMMENALGDLSIDPFTLTRELLLEKVKAAEDSLTKTRIEVCRDINRETIKSVVEHVRTKWC